MTRVLLACLTIVAMPSLVHAQTPGMCAEPWNGITKMKGTIMVTGTGQSMSSGGSFSLNQQVMATPDLDLQPPTFPSDPSYQWQGPENASVNYNITTTDSNNNTSTSIGGPAQNGMGGAAQVILGIDPNSCTYNLYVDAFVTVTNTDASGNKVQLTVPWGPSGEISQFAVPLPTTGTALSGSKSIVDTTSYPGTVINWNISWLLDGSLNCKVDLPVIYAQDASPWGTQMYDHMAGRSDNPTIGRWGCAMTSLDMAMIYAGWTGFTGQGDTTPDELNARMIEYGDFGGEGGSVMFDAAVRDVSPNLKFDTLGAPKNSIDDPVGAENILRAGLCAANPHPVLVGVKLGVLDKYGNRTPGHFVLVTAKDDTGYTVVDPSGGVTHKLSDFSGYATRGIVRDPPGDISQLDLLVYDHAAIRVTDPLGNVSGFDDTKGVMQQIPRSGAWSDNLIDDVDGTTTTPTSYTVQMFQPIAGDYRVDVEGLDDGPFALDVHGFTLSGSAQPRVLIHGTAQAGVTTTYYVHYSSADGSTTTVDQTPANNGDTTMPSPHGAGCGCRAGGDLSSTAGSWALLVGVAIYARRRRKRRPAVYPDRDGLGRRGGGHDRGPPRDRLGPGQPRSE